LYYIYKIKKIIKIINNTYLNKNNKKLL
jgi:hypothetical protein